MTDRSDVDAVAAVMARSGLWWAVAGGWAEADFDAAVPHLDEHDARWLRHALDLTLPGHPWVRRLAHR